jgi:hypothetical protein
MEGEEGGRAGRKEERQVGRMDGWMEATGVKGVRERRGREERKGRRKRRGDEKREEPEANHEV